jgi:hypothetical protein
VLYDRRGLVRVNNFALPGDIRYFTAWSIIGSNGRVLTDQELPWGQLSEGRREDDVRATGLLLYHFLTSRPSGSTTIDPPGDGRLRFQRSTPPELCDLIARAVIRQHPQHITTADVFYNELKPLAEALEPSPVRSTQASAYYTESGASSRPLTTDHLPSALPVGEQDDQVSVVGSTPLHNEASRKLPTMGILVPPVPVSAVSDMSVKLAAARRAAYGEPALSPEPARRINLPVLILSGLALFALCFIIGYFLAQGLLR